MEISNAQKEETVEVTPLNLVNSIKVNDNLTLNFYKASDDSMIIGMDHFNFEAEVLLKDSTAQKMCEIMQLVLKNKETTDKIKSLSESSKTI